MLKMMKCNTLVYMMINIISDEYDDGDEDHDY
jgi:hypothetical protein